MNVPRPRFDRGGVLRHNVTLDAAKFCGKEWKVFVADTTRVPHFWGTASPHNPVHMPETITPWGAEQDDIDMWGVGVGDWGCIA